MAFFMLTPFARRRLASADDPDAIVSVSMYDD